MAYTFTYEKLANGEVRARRTPKHISCPNASVPAVSIRVRESDGDAAAFHVKSGQDFDHLIYPATDTIVLIVGGVTTTIAAGSGSFQAAFDTTESSTVFQKANSTPGSTVSSLDDVPQGTIRKWISPEMFDYITNQMQVNNP